MNRDQFVARTKAARAEWDSLLARLTDAQMLQPGACGDWTAKDVIAHIAWHEHEMINLLKARALAGSELWNAPLHERNAAIFSANKDRGLAEVRADAEQTWRLVLSLLEGLEDEDLRDPGRFAGMPAEWRPGQLIASNTYEHYEEHIPELRAWLAKSGLAA